MDKNGIFIIDKTITVLWEIYGNGLLKNKLDLEKLIRLIYQVSNAYIEIPLELHNHISPLLEDIKIRKVNKDNMTYLQAKDIMGINKLEKQNMKNVRIEINDDLILYSYNEILSDLINKLGKDIEVSIQNKNNCGVAMSLEWIRLGGKKIVTSFNGIGENTPLEEILCTLEFIEGKRIGGKYHLISKLSELFEDITCIKIESNKPIIGRKIFDVESGIHVDGILKNPRTFEPYEPELVGKRRNVVLGKHSGSKSVEVKLNELNIPYEKQNIIEILEKIRKNSNEKGRGLYSDEIRKICKGRWD